MAASEPSVEPSGLARLVPLNGLLPEQLEELADEIELLEIPAGQIFDLGPSSAGNIHHLIEGELELLKAGRAVTTLMAGTEDARLPLRHSKVDLDAARPRAGGATLMRVDRARVSTLLILAAAPQTVSADWAARVMESALFTRVPPANVRRIFELMEAVKVPAGETVIRQGDTGDYYYIVREGRCEVTHVERNGGTVVRLAELGPGDGFGEEALVSDVRRNASVTMVTDGVLMRMKQPAFVELIRNPLLEVVDWRRAAELVGGGARWLDVRLPDEHAANGLPGSTNIPLGELRVRSRELDRGVRYVLYCNSGRRSAAGAFLLTQLGIEAYVVDDGLLGRTLTGSPESRPAEAAPAGVQAQLLLANAELEDALREKARADAERALAVDESGGAHESRTELAERQKRLEEVSRLANRAMHDAQRRKLALEAQMRTAESEAEAQRQKAEAEIERLRKQSEAKLRAEEARLQKEYARAAAQLKELSRSQQEAEARFEQERKRLAEEHARQRAALESEAERLRGQAQALKSKAQSEVDRIRHEQDEKERGLRGALEQRLRGERARLESEFAMSLAQQDRARHDLVIAEAAKHAAKREAERLSAELAAAEKRRQSEETTRRRAHLQRIEADMSRAERRIADAERERAQIEDTMARVRSDATAPQDEGSEDTETEQRLRAELQGFQSKLEAAEAEISAASEAKAQAEAAQARAEHQLARQDELEGRLRLQLQEEAESWLADERRAAEAELQRLKELETGLERIQREKEQKRQAQAAADEGLMADIMSQLGDGEGDPVERSRHARSMAEEKAMRAREAEAEAAAERERVQEALVEAERKVELLRKRRGLD